MYMTRRQKEILDFLNRYIERKGYAPTIEETADHFGLSSLATVHKHLTNLQKKGLVKRDWNRSRALELVPTQVTVRAVELPLLGRDREFAVNPGSWRHKSVSRLRQPLRGQMQQASLQDNAQSAH